MRTSFGLALLTLIALLGAAGAQSSDAVRYRISRPLNWGGGDFCYCDPVPWDINELGGIAGSAYAHDYDFVSIFHDGETGRTTWWTQPGYSVATNENGEFAGLARGWPYPRMLTYFRTSGGTLIVSDSIPHPGDVFPLAINDASEIVGAAGVQNAYWAFRWNPWTNEFVALGDFPGGNESASPGGINNLGQIVGTSQSGRGGAPNSSEAFVWIESAGMQRMPDLADGGYAETAGAINERGQIVGWARLTAERREPFLWDPVDGYTLFGPELANYYYVGLTGFNLRGQVVGQGLESGLPSRGFIWDRESGLRFLHELSDPCDPRGPDIDSAGGINDQGIIAAHCDCDTDFGGYALLLTPYLLGDLDENRQVDMDDLVALLMHFGRTNDATFAHGDLDCDEDVDLQDLSSLLAAFGQSLP